jgi:prepilin-type N-terminal cleavage/methylation domain-containing protein
MNRSTSGFTIIELLIAIVVISILASFVFASYGNTQKNARNASRYLQVQQWQKSFELYKAKFGTYPQVTVKNYCLGVSFPLGTDSQRRCRDSAMTDPNYSYLESDNAALMTEIKKISTIPTNNPPRINGDLVGPYVNYWNTGMSITQVFEGGPSDCPKNMGYSWDDGHGTLLCYLDIGN